MPQVSFVKALGPNDPGSDLDEQNAAEANPALWQHVFAADRTEKPDNRFSPADKQKRVHWQEEKKNRATKPRMRPYVEVPLPPKQWPRTPSAGPGTNRPNGYPTNKLKSNSSNTKDPNPSTQPIQPKPFNKEFTREGEKKENVPVILKRQPNVQKSDFVMKDDPRVPNQGPERTLKQNPPKSKFTTEMRRRFTASEIYQRILNAEVTVPLGGLLAVSPEIERTLSNETKVRSVAVTQPTERDFDREMADAFPSIHQEQDSEPSDEDIGDRPSCTEGAEVEGRAGWSSPDTSRVFTAQGSAERNRKDSPPISPTASFILRVGHIDGVVAMVDSGAEMNMITPRLAEELRNYYAEDDRGRDYKMKNVSGVVENLQGKFDRIPCAVGGASFEETFFVGGPWNSHFSAILGQTFLQNNACQLIWNHGGDNRHVIMKMHPNGDFNGNSITVRLVKDPHVRKRRPASIGVAQIHFSDLSEQSDEEIIRGPDFEHSLNEENSMRRELDQETIQHTEDEFSVGDSDEENIWGDTSSTETEQESQPTTGHTSMTDGEARSTTKPELTWKDHGIRQVNVSQFETIILPTAQNLNLDSIYNSAINDLR